MSEPIKVPVARTRELAKVLGADAVIVVAFRGDSFATTSYGKTPSHCRAFAKVADLIHDDIAHGVIDIPRVEALGE